MSGIDVQIDISGQEATFGLFAGTTYEMTVGSVSIHMSAEQFQQMCDHLRPWVVEGAA